MKKKKIKGPGFLSPRKTAKKNHEESSHFSRYNADQKKSPKGGGGRKEERGGSSYLLEKGRPSTLSSTLSRGGRAQKARLNPAA